MAETLLFMLVIKPYKVANYILHQNLSKLLVLLYFLSVTENLFLALLHVPIHMITVVDVQSFLFKSSAIKRLKVEQEW